MQGREADKMVMGKPKWITGSAVGQHVPDMCVSRCMLCMLYIPVSTSMVLHSYGYEYSQFVLQECSPSMGHHTVTGPEYSFEHMDTF